MSEATERLWSEFALANEQNPAQKHRWRMIAEETRRRLKGNERPRIADLGCGSGALLAHVSESVAGATLIGVDAEPLALAIAARRLPNAELHQADLETGRCPAVEALQIDAILCSEVLEHLSDPAQAVRLAARVLRPGGFAVVTVPSGSMTAFDRAIGHRRHYSLRELETLLETNGLNVVRSYRWGFPFHTLFRLGMEILPNAAASFADRKISGPKQAVLAFLDALFRLNVRSRRVGRQLVAVAQREIS